MLEMLVGAALRSLLLAGLVGLGLRWRRVHDPRLRLTAWTVVLGACLLMPAMTRIAASAGPLIPLPPVAMVLHAGRPAADAAAIPATPVPAELAPPAAPSGRGAQDPAAFAWASLALPLYLLVAGLLLAWLLAGLALSWRIVRCATPVQAGWTAGRDVRVSPRITAPATFGTVILLPPDQAGWSAAKRAAVLAHEAAHVARHDFLVQIIARLHRAVFWFNPLSWWLQRHLSDLAEAASDDAAILGLNDRLVYAEILLDVSARAGRLPGAVAMARAATVRARVERILAQTAAPARTSRRARAVLVCALLLPVLVVAGPLSATPSMPDDMAVADRLAPHHRIGIDPRLLDADAGFYEDMASGSVMTVTRDGDHLLTGRTGQPQVAEYPYTAHDFFLTIAAEQNSFVADAAGVVDHVIHTKNGLATTLDRITPARAAQLQGEYEQRVAEELRPRTPVPLDPAALDDDVGDYALSPTYIFSVTRVGDQLFVQGTDRKAFPVFPYTAHDFFYTAAAAQLSFVGAGPATSMILHQDGRDRTATRVGPEVVRQLQQRLEEERAPHAPSPVAGPLLDRYVGRYANPAITIAISRARDHLSAQVIGYNPYPIYAYSERDFFATSFPAQISFRVDEKGRVVGMVRHEHGEDQVLSKVE